MKNSLVIFTLLLSCFATEVSATHIVAGFSSYKHLSGDAYEIKFTVIRDQLSNGATFDDQIFAQVYTYDGTSYEFQGNILTELGEIKNVVHDEQTPIAEAFLVQLEQTEYSFEFELSNPDVDYQFVYQRCCRTPTFTNILNPEETGISLTTTITAEAQAVQNSSIEFTTIPGFIAVANMESTIAIDVNSLDGDELSYQFTPNYAGGGLDGTTGTGDAFSCTGITPQGPCFPPYEQVDFTPADLNFFNPFPGWQNQGMDATNGTLQGTPSVVGQYSYGFAIHESRNGVIINTTSFDYVVYVLPFVSATEDISESKLLLKGNPSEGSFIIESGIDEDLNYEIINLKGERIKAVLEQSSNLVKIDFDGPAGMYILKVYNETINENLKLIKL